MDQGSFPVVAYETDKKLDMKKLELVDPDQVIQGNVKALDLVLEELAYVDVKKNDTINGNPEAHRAYDVLQFGLQYLLYSIGRLKHNNAQIENYLEEENKKTENIQELLYQQKMKLNELRQQKRFISEEEANYRKITNKIQVECIIAGEASPDNNEDGVEESKTFQQEKKDLTPEKVPQRGKLFKEPHPEQAAGDNQSVLQISKVAPVEELKQKYTMLNSVERDELRKLLFQENIQNPASLSKVIKNEGQGNEEIDIGSTLKKVPNNSGGVLNNLSTIHSQRMPVSSFVRGSAELAKHSEVNEDEEEERREKFDIAESNDFATTKKFATDFNQIRNDNHQPGAMHARNLQDIDQFLQNKQKADDISIEEFKL